MAKSLLAIKLLPKRLNSLVEPVLIFILAASPLLFGSIRPFHVVVMESATALLLFTWLAVSLKKGYFQFITVPGALPVLAFIAYLFAQYVYANGLLYGVYLPGEAYRYKMKEELLKVIMYAVLFYAVLNNFFYRRRLKRLIYALVFIGFCLALLGLIQKLSGAQKIFWVSPLPEGKNRDFFSSFPSRDHFANYMNMLIFITLGFIFSRLPLLREAVKGFDKASISKGIALAFTHKIWLFTFALIIMASAVFYSLCRGAIISFFLALLFFSVLVVATGLTKRGNIVLISVIIFTAMMLVWVKAPEQINERFSKGLGTDTRFSHMIFKERRVFMDTTIEMIKTYPVFGIGTGAFEFVYDKNFKPKGFLQKNYVNHAHNDILEFISEAGLFGTAMFLLVSGFYIFFFVRIFSKRHDPLAVGVGIGASAAMLSMLLHSLFDFNFHITSNAILFFVISAIGLCAAGSRVEGSMDKSLLPMTRAIPVKNIFVKIVLFMMLLCGLIYAVWFIVRPYTAYRLIYKKNPALVELNRARMVLPLSDKCHFALAEFFTAHAAGDKKDEYVRLAREEIKTAIRLNPWYEYYQTYLEWIDKTFAE